MKIECCNKKCMVDDTHGTEMKFEGCFDEDDITKSVYSCPNCKNTIYLCE